MPPTTVLNYHSPGSPGHRRYLSALEDLRRRDALMQLSAWSLMFFALPFLFVGPLIVGQLFWAAAFNFGVYIPYSLSFLAIALIMVPGMFLGEARQRGGLFAGAALDVSPGGLDGAPLSSTPVIAMGELGVLVAFATNPRLAASGFVEIFLFGPRLLLDGLTKLRRAGRLHYVARERAAEVISELGKFDRGIPTVSLQRQGEPAADLIPVLCLLVFHNWIGVSRAGDSVWLLTDARKRLED